MMQKLEIAVNGLHLGIYWIQLSTFASLLILLMINLESSWSMEHSKCFLRFGLQGPPGWKGGRIFWNLMVVSLKIALAWVMDQWFIIVMNLQL